MKPLFHPAAEDITVEGILHALADPVRMHIFAEIAAAGGPVTCSPFLEVGMRPIPKSTLSQHFRVLRDAGLVYSERKGVEMHNVARLEELHPRFPPRSVKLHVRKRRAGAEQFHNCIAIFWSEELRYGQPFVILGKN